MDASWVFEKLGALADEPTPVVDPPPATNPIPAVIAAVVAT